MITKCGMKLIYETQTNQYNLKANEKKHVEALFKDKMF